MLSIIFTDQSGMLDDSSTIIIKPNAFGSDCIGGGE